MDKLAWMVIGAIVFVVSYTLLKPFRRFVNKSIDALQEGVRELNTKIKED